jgi:predicted transcriptional regulator
MPDEGTTDIELLLNEPEIRAWLTPVDDGDDDGSDR